MPAYAMATEVPSHVPPQLVYDYDVFEPGPAGSDFYAELYALKRNAPPVFAGDMQSFQTASAPRAAPEIGFTDLGGRKSAKVTADQMRPAR